MQLISLLKRKQIARFGIWDRQTSLSLRKQNSRLIYQHIAKHSHNLKYIVLKQPEQSYKQFENSRKIRELHWIEKHRHVSNIIPMVGGTLFDIVLFSLLCQYELQRPLLSKRTFKFLFCNRFHIVYFISCLLFPGISMHLFTFVFEHCFSRYLFHIYEFLLLIHC